MPGTGARYLDNAYFVLPGVMVLIAVGLLLLFRKMRWLWQAWLPPMPESTDSG